MELHPLKMLLHSQGDNQQSEKASYKIGGNICKKRKKTYAKKEEVNLQIYKVLLQFNRGGGEISQLKVS